MNDTVGDFLISPHFLDSSSSFAPISSARLYSEISNCNVLKNESERTTEANDVLKNGILIETNKGLKCLSLTEALTCGVGGLNLSVEDFQNVAAQLLHSQTPDRETADSGDNAVPVHCFERNSSKLDSFTDTSAHSEGAKVANEDIKPVVILSNGVSVKLTNRHILKKKVKTFTSSDSLSLTVSENLGKNRNFSVQSVPLTQKLESIADTSTHNEEAKVASKGFKPIISLKGVNVTPHTYRLILKKKVKVLTSSDSSSLTLSESTEKKSDSFVQLVPLTQKLESIADASAQYKKAKAANKYFKPIISSKGVSVTPHAYRHILKKVKPLTSSQSSSLTVSESTEKNSDSSIHSNPLSQKPESITEASKHFKEAKVANENFKPIISSNGISATLNNGHILKQKVTALTLSDSDSSSLTVSESTEKNSDSSVQSVPPIQVKRKGGWPKGRKRKPELANRPPKAPCTGYVFYLNEKRKRPEFGNMPFPEVTKILGNEWSSLSLENRKEYLEKAEIDKKRYREEMKIYRNSDTYRSNLKRRRIRSYETNGTEESDFDTTYDIDDEDNEELYCRACNQWFTTLHNKKEHLSGKQHFQVILQTGKGSSSLDESSLYATSKTNLKTRANPGVSSVPDAMNNFFHNITEREREIKTLQERLKTSVVENTQILKQLQELMQSLMRLQKLSRRQNEDKCKLEKVICHLWDVPSMFCTEKSLALKSHRYAVVKTIRK